jgi:hypothetical protein
MKYIKLYEVYFTTEEIMGNLRTIAKRIVNNLLILPDQENGEVTWENYRTVVKMKSKIDEAITFVEVSVYLNEMHIGNVCIDFISEKPYILIAYDINFQNEGLIHKEIKAEKCMKSYYGITKGRPVRKPLISAPLPK